MKKRVILFFIFLSFSHPLYADTSPQESIDLIVSAISKDDYAVAGKRVNRFLKKHPEDIWHFRALYLKAHISKKLSRLNDAVGIYLNLLSRYPQLKDYTLLKLAGARLELREEGKSFDLLNRLLKEFPQSRLYPYAKFFLGKLHFNRGELKTAYKFFTDIINNYPKSDLAPESMFFIGVILEKQEKTVNAYKTFVKLFHSYPLNKFALEAEEKIRVTRMAQINLPEFPPSLISKRIKLLMKEREYSIVSRECKKYLKVYKEGPLFQDLTFTLAGVYTSMRKREKSIHIYKSFISKYRSSARIPEAQYNIANIYWNQGKYDNAIEYSQKVINKFPHSPYAEKALYITGQIFTQRKKYTEATDRFQKMIKSFPKGPFAVRGHWQIGWVNYIMGNYPAAAKKFAATAYEFQDSPFRDRLLYWAGKSYEKAGETETARSFYKKVAKEYPYNYYGHRGRAKLNKKSGNKVQMINPFLQRELETYPVYEEVKTKMSPEDSFHFARIKELIALGYYKDTLEEIQFIAGKVSVSAPEKILWIGNLYTKAKGYVESLRIIDGLLRELSLKKQLELSSEYWKLYFPLAYRELLNKNAKSYKIDPFLIAGLIRQESAFDPDALSRSGAIGLMQLMPETGKSEFKKRYRGKFYEEILFIPKINISLGSQHLARLLKKTKGNPVIALAAYNAGLSRALEWNKTLVTSDPDIFIETIPFRETKTYIKKVLSNYFNYIMLYGAGEEKDKVLALNIKDL